MKKNTNSPIRKHHDAHYLEARTSHLPETEMEVASEFFDDGFIRPLDTEDVFTDQLIDHLKNDSQD